LTAIAASAIGVALTAAAHRFGWPVAEGGSAAISHAMIDLSKARGVTFETGITVSSLDELGTPDIVMLDTAPAAAARIAGNRMPRRIRRAMTKFRHGPGTFKVDYAIEGEVPWQHEPSRSAGTVHLGGTAAEISQAERAVSRGQMPPRPYVLVGQQYVADPTRSAGNINPLYAYAHVPAGYDGDATEAITRQIERFAPGFRDRILASHVSSTSDLQAHNVNYVGGDIVTGSNDPLQLVFRPRATLHPYSTGARGVYLCSAATPPGAGAHGMCGYNAANYALTLA
jgi:phytoene dehydrogenase-like protein